MGTNDPEDTPRDQQSTVDDSIPGDIAPEVTYSEFKAGSQELGVIMDTTNSRAWIESTVTVPIEP